MRRGQVVPTSFSCAEQLGGLGLVTCRDSNGVNTATGGHGQLDTSTLGAHAYTVTATSSGGLSNTASITYTVAVPAPAGSTPGGGTTPGGTTTPGGGTAPPSAAEIAAALAKQLAPTGKAAGLATLVKTGAFTQSLTTLAGGTIVIRWYYLPPGARLAAKPKPILVATGRQTLSAAGTVKIKIELTSAGKKRLKKAKRIKLTAQCTFTPTGGTPWSAPRRSCSSDRDGRIRSARNVRADSLRGMLEQGTSAPDFALPDQDGDDVKLSDLKGQTVVLYFYPKADTPGCTTQACGVRDHLPDYERPACACSASRPTR